ncbi:hypothetical protein QR685DRAFT_200055 [Neurospora intermedia]|uniref:Uncharacterized protein n=1 Tax=Neurospora intermedia TaxID=5142 RepID=A0ABR3DHF1_NEUIN
MLSTFVLGMLQSLGWRPSQATRTRVVGGSGSKRPFEMMERSESPAYKVGTSYSIAIATSNGLFCIVRTISRNHWLCFSSDGSEKEGGIRPKHIKSSATLSAWSRRKSGGVPNAKESLISVAGHRRQALRLLMDKTVSVVVQMSRMQDKPSKQPD